MRRIRTILTVWNDSLIRVNHGGGMTESKKRDVTIRGMKASVRNECVSVSDGDGEAALWPRRASVILVRELLVVTHGKAVAAAMIM